MLFLWAQEDGADLPAGPPGEPRQVGTVFFHIEPFATVRPFTRAQSAQPARLLYRATVVDGDFGDHHPQSTVADYEFVRANSNNDDKVDIADPVFTLAYLFGQGDAPNCFDAADANNDGKVDVADPIYTLGYLFGGGPQPPPPFPECGIDAGPEDLLDCNPCSCGPYTAGDPCAGP